VTTSPIALQATPTLASPQARPTPQQNEALQQRLDAFWAATVNKPFGVDTDTVEATMLWLHKTKQLPAFNQALAHKARHEGYSFTSVQDVLREQYGGNALNQAVKEVPRKDAMALLYTGKKQYDYSPTDLRVRGAWMSLVHLTDIVKQYPVMASLLIGGGTLLSARFPFLGGLSGAVIMAVSGTEIVRNELKARAMPPAMTPEKAQCYQNSGSNITAFACTALGADDILKSLKVGGEAMATASQATGNPLLKLVQVPWAAITAKMHEGSHVGLRFLVGLVDNWVLPFDYKAKALAKQHTLATNTPSETTGPPALPTTPQTAQAIRLAG
jgi:hypothetical protein